MKNMACVGIVILMSWTVLAQSQSAGTAPPADPPPTAFEVAAIKPAPPGTQRMPKSKVSPSGLAEFEGSLQQLVALAMDVSPSLGSDLLVGPSFLESERFTITARIPHKADDKKPIPMTVVRNLLHNLFVERFKLATHVEERQLMAYSLVVAKGGPKLKKADASQPAKCKATPGAVPGPDPMAPPIAFTCQNTTMAELSHNLQRWANVYFDHPVVDTTGLQGGYDFVVAWTPLSELRGASGSDQTAPAAASAAEPGSLTVFDAVESQLGLKLKKERRPVSVIVIDHIEQQPIE